MEWTSNRSATRPDPLHPMHRHDVGRARAPDRTELEHVAIAMRQKRHYRLQAPAGAPLRTVERGAWLRASALSAKPPENVAQGEADFEGNTDEQQALRYRMSRAVTRKEAPRGNRLQPQGGLVTDRSQKP